MSVRTLTALLVTSVVLAAAPASAQDLISPYNVLSGKNASGFSSRTSRIISIMGSDLDGAAPLKLANKPHWQRPVRRDADATGGIR